MHHVSDEKRMEAIQDGIREGVDAVFGYAIREVKHEGADRKALLKGHIKTFIEGMLHAYQWKGDIHNGKVNRISLQDGNAIVNIGVTWPLRSASFTIPGYDRAAVQAEAGNTEDAEVSVS